MKPQWYFLIFWNFLFGIFDYVSGRNWTETEWSFLFSLFLGLFQHIFAWKEAITVFFYSLLFFWNFLLRVVEERNRTIIFISTFSRPFPTYFGLKLTQNDYFFYFFAIFLEFSITRRVGTEWNDNFYFLSFSAFPPLFWLEMKR